MIAQLRRFWRSETCISILLVSLISLLCYAPLIPWLGFYWDDWFFIWVGHAEGAKGLISNLSIDRPFLGVLFALNYALLGPSPLRWHIFVFLIRWLGALALLWGLRGLWPKQRFATTTMALLFLVYPGFLQQPIACAYHTWLIAFALGVLSLAATVRAERARSRARYIMLTALAMSAGLAYLLILELLIGLEALRLILLWHESQDEKTSLRTRVTYVGKRWLPNLLITTGFLIWRLFFFTSTRAATDVSLIVGKYIQTPLAMLLRLPIELWRDFLESATFAWLMPVAAAIARMSMKAFLAAQFLASGSIALVLFYYWWLHRHKLLNDSCEPQEARLWARDTLLIGTLAVLFAAIPTLLAGRHVELLGRYTLPTSVGASLVIVAAIYLIIRPTLRPWLLATLVGLSIITHFDNANQYRANWRFQRDLWWQFSWRVPQLEPGTVIVLQSPDPPANYEIWGAANMIYSFEERQTLLWGRRLDEDIARSIETADRTEDAVRKVTFDRDMGNTLIISMPRLGTLSCLRVLDSARMELPSNADSLLRSVASHSRIDRIRVNEANAKPPSGIFGEEPTHTWCYYFQKSDLARQRGDWQQVAQIGDEARRLDFKPSDVTEWLPMIEGYVNVGRYDDVREIVGLVLQATPTIRSALCNVWSRTDSISSPDVDSEAFIAGMKAQLSCPVP